MHPASPVVKNEYSVYDDEMPKVTDAHRTERRRQITEGARRAFGEHGYAGATVEVLEAEIGLSRGAIFSYFPSKLDLFVALAQEDQGRLIELWLDRGWEGVVRHIIEDDPEWIGVYLDASRMLRTACSSCIKSSCKLKRRGPSGPRDACESPIDGGRVQNCSKDSLGGQLFWATTAEVRFPFPFVPENLGMQGAVFVDAGSLWDPSQLAVNAVNQEGSFIFDSSQVRLSTGFSLIWQSPLGPLRADFAQALLKADFDRTELFRFGASTNF